jgi:hypothetical protein
VGSGHRLGSFRFDAGKRETTGTSLPNSLLDVRRQLGHASAIPGKELFTDLDESLIKKMTQTKV